MAIMSLRIKPVLVLRSMKNLNGYSKWGTLTTLIATLILQGCSANWYLKQAIRKDPSLKKGVTQVWDTTIVTKERQVIDTLWTTKDTTLVRDSVVIRYRLLGNGAAQIDVTCPPEKIKIQKEYVTQVIESPRSMKPFLGWIALLLTLTILFLLNPFRK